MLVMSKRRKREYKIMRHVRVQIQDKVILYILLKGRKISKKVINLAFAIIQKTVLPREPHLFSLTLKNYSLCHKAFALRGQKPYLKGLHISLRQN